MDGVRLPLSADTVLEASGREHHADRPWHHGVRVANFDLRLGGVAEGVCP